MERTAKFVGGGLVCGEWVRVRISPGAEGNPNQVWWPWPSLLHFQVREFAGCVDRLCCRGMYKSKRCIWKGGREGFKLRRFAWIGKFMNVRMYVFGWTRVWLYFGCFNFGKPPCVMQSTDCACTMQFNETYMLEAKIMFTTTNDYNPSLHTQPCYICNNHINIENEKGTVMIVWNWRSFIHPIILDFHCISQ